MIENTEKTERQETIDLTEQSFSNEVAPIDKKTSSVASVEPEIIVGRFRESPYESGFDAKHPLPTYEQLRNAGFTNNEARIIRYGYNANYSQKELYKVLYESDDPVKAYRKMIKKKVEQLLDR